MIQRWSMTAALAVTVALLGASAFTATVSAGQGAEAQAEEEARAAALSNVEVDIRPLLAEGDSPAEAIAQRRAAGLAGLDGQRTGFRPQVTRQLAQGGNEMMIEDFEVSLLDPFKWLLIYDINGTDFGEYFWTLEQCHASSRYGGVQSLWALGGGRDGETLACEDPNPRGTRASALLTLDLTGFAEDVRQLDLIFDFFLNTRTFQEEGIVPDGMFLILYPDVSNLVVPVVIDGVTAAKPEGFFINPLEYDLTNMCNDYAADECYNLAGKEVVLEFFFITQMRNGTRLPGGAFIDNIRLVSEATPLMFSQPAPQPALRALDLIRLDQR
jgi:hypothetical protein